MQTKKDNSLKSYDDKVKHLITLLHEGLSIDDALVLSDLTPKDLENHQVAYLAKKAQATYRLFLISNGNERISNNVKGSDAILKKYLESQVKEFSVQPQVAVQINNVVDQLPSSDLKRVVEQRKQIENSQSTHIDVKPGRNS